MNRFTVTVLVLSSMLTASLALRAQQPSAGDGPRYTNGTNLIRPVDYRAWPFLGSGLGLTYEDQTGGAETPATFTNVFVNPSSYRGFMQTGTWPDGSVFVLEFRRSQSEGSPNRGGRFQTDLLALEANVKDSRFPDGWAFFRLGRGTALLDVAEPLSGDAVAPCIECHTEHTAVERTFVQFYPTLLEVAREKGTVKPGF